MADWTAIVKEYEAKIADLERELAAKLENEAKVYKVNLVAAGVAFVIGVIAGHSF